MKKINAISLLFLLASAQMYGITQAGADLAFVLACQAADSFYDVTESDADDIIAVQIIEFMNNCIATDANLKEELAASVNGYLFKGKPLDPLAIAAQDKKLQDSIKNYNNNIKKLKGSNKTLAPVHKGKINSRQNARDDQKAKLKENLTAIQANTTAENVAKANADMINNLIEQNQLSLDQAIEYYIATFGQCYTLPGSVYGSSIVISSRYNKNMPITPNEYNDLVSSLNQASSQFGSTISIQLALGDNGVDATIKDVAGYVSKMAPSSASYSTYAFVGLGTAAAIVSAMAYNINAQGKDWSDPAEYASLGKESTASVVANAQNLFNQVYSYMTGTQEDGTPALAPTKSSSNLYDINQSLEGVGGLTVYNAMKGSDNLYDTNQNLADGGGLAIIAGMKQMYQDAKKSFGSQAAQIVNAYDNQDYSFDAGYGDEGLSTNVYQTPGDQTALPYVAGAGALALVGPTMATAAQNTPAAYRLGQAVYNGRLAGGATRSQATATGVGAAAVSMGAPASAAIPLGNATGSMVSAGENVMAAGQSIADKAAYAANRYTALAPEFGAGVATTQAAMAAGVSPRIAQGAYQVGKNAGQAALQYGAAAVPAAAALGAVSAANSYNYDSSLADTSSSAADDAMWAEYLNS